jgi:hypothetical protein
MRFTQTLKVVFAALTAVGEASGAQSAGAAARAAARSYRQSHEPAILDEFVGLLAIPNLATDSSGIARNADYLMKMLSRRGFANT